MAVAQGLGGGVQGSDGGEGRGSSAQGHCSIPICRKCPPPQDKRTWWLEVRDVDGQECSVISSDGWGIGSRIMVWQNASGTRAGQESAGH